MNVMLQFFLHREGLQKSDV